MRKTDNTFAMNTGANGGDWRAERIVGLLRDMLSGWGRVTALTPMTPAASCVRSIRASVLPVLKDAVG
jgi:hypothetical protein